MAELPQDEPALSLPPQVNSTVLSNTVHLALDTDDDVVVWGTNESTLQEQAKEQFDLLSTFSHGKAPDEASNKSSTSSKVIGGTSLDITAYLRRQEDLRRLQQAKKSQQCSVISEKSVRAAMKISNFQSTSLCNKRSRNSDSENDLSDNECTTDSKRARNELAGVRERDDGNMQLYLKRLKKTHEQCPDIVNDIVDIRGLKAPRFAWNRLFNYQKEGVEWLWELHQNRSGGLLADEMGLGKTVQLITFFAALDASMVISKHATGSFVGLGPTLIVCPATVIDQWVSHFHEWAPEFRVLVLHQSGSYMKADKRRLLHDVAKSQKGVVICTYSGVIKYGQNLREFRPYWHYLVLDEGHKIRNPNTRISRELKSIQSPHRIMLTGSPLQNSLQELWNLMDFTNPALLGDLETFTEHFVSPIVRGGFDNATAMQLQTAQLVGDTLKKIITPYLLRRTKREVQDCIQLPTKNEQVLFCSLTDEQKDLYKGYLMADHVNQILGRDTRHKQWISDNKFRANMLIAITTLRKICNHPELYLNEEGERCHYEDDESNSSDHPSDDIWYHKRSGKMIVVAALLKMWKRQGHRVLLFTQGRAMLKVLETFLIRESYSYLKMDGQTPVTSRQASIDKFNQDSTIDVFLLTTRVGGLGVNLTGADRVIIFDPDWNPATDTQARERAWRIGQNRSVTIYRLLSAGTIEEKMYQRQVWKQLLSNEILQGDVSAHRSAFKPSNLFDLFSFNETTEATETANIFRNCTVKVLEKNNDHGTKSKSDKTICEKDCSTIQPQTSRKNAYELSREQRLRSREEWKKLTPPELRQYNRAKEQLEQNHVADICNEVDDCRTEVDFANALSICQTKLENSNKVRLKVKPLLEDVKPDVVIDRSGVVDGEKVDGLVKCEVQRPKKKHKRPVPKTDDDILERLLSKNGISGALHHDRIVGDSTESKPVSLRVQVEAGKQANRALQAIRRKKLNKWRW